MEKDFSKLLPALFNDKDLCFTELMENFFEEFDGTYCCNVQGTTFVGFVDDQEVRIHAVVNRIELEFTDGKPSWAFIDKIVKWFEETIDNERFAHSVWKLEDDRVVAQYYWNN